MNPEENALPAFDPEPAIWQTYRDIQRDYGQVWAQRWLIAAPWIVSVCADLDVFRIRAHWRMALDHFTDPPVADGMWTRALGIIQTRQSEFVADIESLLV